MTLPCDSIREFGSSLSGEPPLDFIGTPCMTRTPSELDNGLYAPDIYARDETTEPTVDDSDREPLTGKAWNPGASSMPSKNADDDTIRRRFRETGNWIRNHWTKTNLDDSDCECIGQVISNARPMNGWKPWSLWLNTNAHIQSVIPIWFPISQESLWVLRQFQNMRTG